MGADSEPERVKRPAGEPRGANAQRRRARQGITHRAAHSEVSGNAGAVESAGDQQELLWG
jgi:hypothetical protein